MILVSIEPLPYWRLIISILNVEAHSIYHKVMWCEKPPPRSERAQTEQYLNVGLILNEQTIIVRIFVGQ